MIESNRSSLTSALACLLSLLMIFIPAATLSAQVGDPAPGWVDAVPSVRVNTLAATAAASHIIHETSDPDLWDLEKRLPGKAVERAGSFRLQRAMAIGGESSANVKTFLREKGILQNDRQLVLGTYDAPDGSQKFVSGLRFDIVMAEENGTEIAQSVFVPMLDSDDFSKLEELTTAFADALEKQFLEPTVPVKSGPGVAQKSVCINYCEMDLQDAMSKCLTNANICLGLSNVAKLCVFACPATGPLALPCVVACGVGNALAALACLLGKWNCESTARSNDRACRRACAEEHPF